MAVFALQTTNGSALDTSLLAGVNIPAVVADAHAHGIKVLISIGGSDDQNWQNAGNATNRAAFVQNLVNYMQVNGFDGIELDIENSVWAAQGPPSADMTATIIAVSNAAKAVKTQSGNIPLVTADVITNWQGPWFAPSQAYVDQFNLMTYGDTIAGSIQSDVADTIAQGLPANKLVLGIDIIDYPATYNQAKPFADYVVANGLKGVYIFDMREDEINDYRTFNQLAPYR